MFPIDEIDMDDCSRKKLVVRVVSSSGAKVLVERVSHRVPQHSEQDSHVILGQSGE